jgi:ABC-type nickel/cobalt efflux system permease component RcnA
LPLQKLAQQLHKVLLTNCHIILVSWSSPLLNTFGIWEIWQSVKLLCKHAHNKWHMSSEPIVDFKLHKNQHRKTPFIFQVACTMTNSTNFTYSRKLQTSTQDVVIKHHILVKILMSKGGAMHFITFNFIVDLL